MGLAGFGANLLSTNELVHRNGAVTMRLGRVVGWGVRLLAGAVAIVLFGFLLAVLAVAFEGQSTFPAPLRTDAAIARHMPEYRYRDAYEVGVEAPPERVYEILRSADLRSIPALRLMLEARAAPALVRSAVGAGDYRRPVRVTLDTLATLGGFQVLEETAGRSVVLGAIARPWDGGAPRPPFTTESFARFGAPGYVKTALSIDVLQRQGGGTRLTVEWRMVPTDAGAMRRLSRYWLVARPFAQLAAKTGLPRIGTDAVSAEARANRTRARLAENGG